MFNIRCRIEDTREILGRFFATCFLFMAAICSKVFDWFSWGQCCRHSYSNNSLFNATAQEFYFRMCALGTRGNLSESTITRHIVNSINVKEYATCNQLFSHIDSYYKYNDVITPALNVKNKIKLVPSSAKSAWSTPQ